MNNKQKILKRIEGLQKKLETTALLQRNYQKHYKKIKPKYEQQTVLYTKLLNQLRNELQVINVVAVEQPKVDEAIAKMVNVVAVGEETIIIG